MLFGDGAGAVVLVPSRAPGILSAHLHADGSHRAHPVRPGIARPRAQSTGSPFVHMDGQAVFKFAVNVMAQVGAEALAANGIDAARDRLADPAPGEHPDHRCDGEEARHAARSA